MHFFKNYFLLLLSGLLLAGCKGGFTEALYDSDEKSETVHIDVEKDHIYFFGLTPNKKIAVFGEKYHYLLAEQKPKDKQLIAKLVKLPFKQHMYSQMGIVNSTKVKPDEITTELYLALDISKLSKKHLKTAADLGFKNLSYKTAFYNMTKQYKHKIDLEKLNREKKIWYREINLVGHRYLAKEGVNYVAKNHYPFSETIEIHTNLEYSPAEKGPSVTTILLTPFAAVADVAVGILAVPAYIGLQAACIGQNDGFICQ
ncbi:MAG: hypothetical protein Q4D86_03610 [Pasteurella oralis]|uniref:hypothetical protein n=1 Tax=Pasteurella oralis TaxID=1071947 RepID=UPI0026F80600|nr:hypothetical protein [Pasteurella oralis]